MKKDAEYWSEYCREKRLLRELKDIRRMSKKKAKSLSYSIRFPIFERDNYKCYICGVEVRPGRKRGGLPLATLDHYIPFSKGGNHNPSNLRTCCYQCNNKKGSRIYSHIKPLSYNG